MLVADVIKATSEVSGLSRQTLLGASRFRHEARPRQVGMYLSHRMVKTTKVQIGRVWGGRDHTTVSHAIETVERLLAEGNLDVIAMIAAITLKVGEAQTLPDVAAIAAARTMLLERIEKTARDLARLQAALAGLDTLLVPGAVQ